MGVCWHAYCDQCTNKADSDSTGSNHIHVYKDNILITDTYPRFAIDHPPITEPHIETPCPTMPVQNPTHEANIFLSIRNKAPYLGFLVHLKTLHDHWLKCFTKQANSDFFDSSGFGLLNVYVIMVAIKDVKFIA